MSIVCFSESYTTAVMSQKIRREIDQSVRVTSTLTSEKIHEFLHGANKEADAQPGHPCACSHATQYCLPILNKLSSLESCTYMSIQTNQKV